MLPAVIKAIYPPQCVGCGTLTDRDFALCGSCWHDTPFLTGLVCDACGTSLPGHGSSEGVLCDDCLQTARPWNKGRAALAYEDLGRRFVLQLKHGDRTDLSRPMAAWMARAAEPILPEAPIIVPVPLHPIRLFVRRYNQAAELGQGLSRVLGFPQVPDALIRTRSTPSLGKMSKEERFRTMQDLFELRPKRQKAIEGRDILLVDDVMTSGATLAACTTALLAGGAHLVNVVTLARAAKAH